MDYTVILGHNRVATKTPEPEDLRAVTCPADPNTLPLVIGVLWSADRVW
jgi:hypothetical protein